MSITNNVELSVILEEENIKNYAVIRIRDLNNPEYKKTRNFILNVGFHWVGLVINKSNAYFSNSFALKPPKQIIDFCRTNNISEIYYNGTQLQDDTSTDCGFFASLFVIKLVRDKTKNIDKYISLFNTTDLLENDGRLIKMFNKII